jgi:hypothetical protein
MSEAKRPQSIVAGWKTLMSGSDAQIAAMIDVFDPVKVARDDAVRLRVLAEAMPMSPPSICTSCGCEFRDGASPAALHCFRQGEDFIVLSGAFCARCASLPPDELRAAVVGGLRRHSLTLTFMAWGPARDPGEHVCPF